MMKKLISFFLVLMMCTTMLPTSFAAESYVVKTGLEVYNVAPNTTFDIPFYFGDASGANDVTFGIIESHIRIPDGFEYEIVPGVLSADEVIKKPNDTQSITVYNDSGVTFSKDAIAFTVKAIAPEVNGAYEVSIYDVMLFDQDFLECSDVSIIGATINVQSSSGDNDESGDIVFEGDEATTSEEYLVGPKHVEYNFAPGETNEIPIYFTKVDGADASFGILQGYIKIPDGFTCEIVPGTLSTADVMKNSTDDSIVIVYNDSGVDFTAGTPAFTLNITAPQNAGAYEMTLYDVMLFDGEFLEITSVEANSAMLNVVDGQGDSGDSDAIEYTVTFKADGVTVDTYTVAEGSVVGILPNAPVKEGYTFDKWVADGEEVTADTVVDSDLVVEAVYTVNKYTVTFKAEGSADVVIEVEYNTAIGAQMPAKPTKENYTFTNWIDVNGGVVTAATVVTGDIVANAEFVQNGQTGGGSATEGDVATTTEDYLVGPKHVSYTVSANQTIDIPVYFSKTDGNDAEFGILQAYIKIPDGIDYEIITGSLTDADVMKNSTDDSIVIVYNDSGASFAANVPAFTLRVTAPAVNGEYAMSVYDVMLFDNVDYLEITSVFANSADLIVINGQEPPKEFTVNFVAEGNAVGEAVIVMEGSEIGTLPNAPAVEGKDFYRWEDENGNEVTATTVVNSDMTITAVYKTQQFSVKFVNGTESVDSIVDYGTTVTLPTAPTKEGYNFIGWFDGNTEIKADTVVKANITAEARFEAKEYNVKFVSFGETLSESKIQYGEKVYLPATPTAKGYRFNGWADENGKAWSQDTVVTGDMTFTADWTAKKYAVEFIAEYETLNGPKKDTLKDGEVEFDSEIIFPADPVIEGYNFLGWYKDDVKIEDGAILEDDKAITIKAKLEKKVYSLLFNSYRSEVPVEVEYLGTIAEEDIPEAVMEPGYRFVKWVVSNANLPEEEWADFDPTKPVTGDLNIVAIDEEITFELEVLGSNGPLTEVTIPYATKATDIAGVITSAIKAVNVVENGETIAENVAYDEIVAIDHGTEKVIVSFTHENEILTADIALNFETKEDYHRAEPAKVKLGYFDHNGKDAAAIANIVKGQIKVLWGNQYGIEEDVTGAIEEGILTLTYADGKLTIAKEGHNVAEVEVELQAAPTVKINPSSILLFYSEHNGADDAEIIELIKGKITSVSYVFDDETEMDVTEDVKDTLNVTYDSAEGKATITTADGLELKDVVITLQPIASSSTASGTVVRPSTGGVTGGGNTNKPSTDDPATDEPATDDPATDEPATDDPATDDPATDEPATDAPATDAPAADVPFTDVKADDWALDAIKDLHSRGIISGDESKALRPDAGITREEVSKIVLSVKGIEVDEAATLDATDADSVSAWAKAYVATAIKEGLLKGYDDGTIQSSKVVTRAEMAAIIVRAIGATAEFTSSSFTDVGDAWYAAEVECAKNLGIVTGYEDGSFQGDKPVTRREAFAMAQRVIKLIEALENN